MSSGNAGRILRERIAASPDAVLVLAVLVIFTDMMIYGLLIPVFPGYAPGSGSTSRSPGSSSVSMWPRPSASPSRWVSSLTGWAAGSLRVLDHGHRPLRRPSGPGGVSRGHLVGGACAPCGYHPPIQARGEDGHRARPGRRRAALRVPGLCRDLPRPGGRVHIRPL